MMSRTCRTQCQIDTFLLERYRTELESYVREMERLPRNSNTRGFLNIASNLQEILTRGKNSLFLQALREDWRCDHCFGCAARNAARTYGRGV